jgi:hypothetical protein
MPAEQALGRIRRDMGDSPVVNVVLGARPNPNQQDDLRRLNISANLQTGFRAIAGNALEDELRLIPYEPGYKPDSGEVCWIDLQQAPEIREIIQRVLNFQALVLYEQDDDFIDSLAYYAVFARVAAQRGIEKPMKSWCLGAAQHSLRYLAVVTTTQWKKQSSSLTATSTAGLMVDMCSSRMSATSNVCFIISSSFKQERSKLCTRFCSE